jgi:hypothetical protein
MLIFQIICGKSKLLDSSCKEEERKRKEASEFPWRSNMELKMEKEVPLMHSTSL